MPTYEEGTRQNPVIIKAWTAQAWVALDIVLPVNLRQKIDDNVAEAIIEGVPEGKFFVFDWAQDRVFQYGVDRRTIGSSRGSYEQEVQWVRADSHDARKVAIKTSHPTVDDATNEKTKLQELQDSLKELDGDIGEKFLTP